MGGYRRTICGSNKMSVPQWFHLHLMYCFKVNDRVIPVYILSSEHGQQLRSYFSMRNIFPNRMQVKGYNVFFLDKQKLKCSREIN